MEPTVQSGFQVVASPAYKVVIFNAISTYEIGSLCRRLNATVTAMGYRVEDWRANPLFIVSHTGWVQPADQEAIKEWVGQQAWCKYLITERDKNDRKQTMVLWLLDEARNPIDLRGI